MIVLALLMAATIASAPVASAQADADSEIVVSAQIERVALTLGRDDQGRTTCSLTKSSGDPAIDSAVCKRASHCMKPGAIDLPKLDKCIDGQKQALIAAWMKGERQ
jgi:hypothetical protein